MTPDLLLMLPASTRQEAGITLEDVQEALRKGAQGLGRGLGKGASDVVRSTGQAVQGTIRTVGNLPVPQKRPKTASTFWGRARQLQTPRPVTRPSSAPARTPPAPSGTTLYGLLAGAARSAQLFGRVKVAAFLMRMAGLVRQGVKDLGARLRALPRKVRAELAAQWSSVAPTLQRQAARMGTAGISAFNWLANHVRNVVKTGVDTARLLIIGGSVVAVSAAVIGVVWTLK